MLSYERGNTPFYGVWFTCGNNLGRETEAGCILVPAGKDRNTLLIALKNHILSSSKEPGSPPGLFRL